MRQHPLLVIERSPRLSAACASVALFVGALASMLALEREAEHTADQALAQELTLLAQVAVRELDVEAHARLTDPEQLNDEHYKEVVAPLQRLVAAAPAVRYVYTVREQAGEIVFAVDAAPPLDTDGDGLIDQAALGEPYDDAPPALHAAFRTGTLQVATQPYSDPWGTFVAAFVPVRRSTGEVEAVLAVEYDAVAHAERLEAMDHAALLGIGVAALTSALVGLVVFLVQRERKRTRDELVDASLRAEGASRAKSEFLANMSHEIRTPMTSILGYAEMLREELRPHDSDGKLREDVEVIVRNGHHLLSVINDVLDLSKIEAGHLEIERVPTEPLVVLGDIVESLRPRALVLGVDLVTEIGAGVPELVIGDPLRLRQILVNLSSNALKFTPHGRVTVRASAIEGGAGIRFDVEDTGIGMTAEQLVRVFEPFEQADSSVTRIYGGTGLGLPISRRLAKMLGGSLTARSEVGQGTCMTLVVPAVPCDPPAPLPSSAHDGGVSAPPLEGFSVLLAEDSAVNRRLVARMLRKAGATVTEVENGRQAVEALCEGGRYDAPLAADCQYDVLLMDMQMPVLDGYSATRILRARGARVWIVALTAHAMTSDRAKCMEAGCDDYATKPIDRHALVTACRRALVRAG
jgi:signal transduction histidine kinase/CheY-like chemotaxis protein